MKRAAAALHRLVAWFGLEGAFLLIGGVLLAIGASFIHPAGPWIVTGGLCVVVGVALAVPTGRGA